MEQNEWHPPFENPILKTVNDNTTPTPWSFAGNICRVKNTKSQVYTSSSVFWDPSFMMTCNFALFRLPQWTFAEQCGHFQFCSDCVSLLPSSSSFSVLHTFLCRLIWVSEFCNAQLMHQGCTWHMCNLFSGCLIIFFHFQLKSNDKEVPSQWKQPRTSWYLWYCIHSQWLEERVKQILCLNSDSFSDRWVAALEKSSLMLVTLKQDSKS